MPKFGLNKKPGRIKDKEDFSDDNLFNEFEEEYNDTGKYNVEDEDDYDVDRQEDEDEDDDHEVVASSISKKKIIIGVLLTVIIVGMVAFIGYSIFSGKKDKPETTQDSGTATASASASVSTPDTPKDNSANKSSEKPKDGDGNSNVPTDVKAGAPDLRYGTQTEQNSNTSDPKDFLKDINGKQIPKNYEVASVTHAVDFVDYTKKRGITGPGVELLWLDAKYKGRPYSVSVPFSIYKELDGKGITVVDVEILHLKGGGTVVSSMTVDPNYKQVLENYKNNPNSTQY